MIQSVINRKPAIVLDDSKAPKFDPQQPGDIIYKDVTFKYPSSTDMALKGINLRIEANKMTALVGASGSGKSTAVKLLERYYDPLSGSITVQGQEMTKINLKSYRQHVGYVG